MYNTTCAVGDLVDIQGWTERRWPYQKISGLYVVVDIDDSRKMVQLLSKDGELSWRLLYDLIKL